MESYRINLAYSKDYFNIVHIISVFTDYLCVCACVHVQSSVTETGLSLSYRVLLETLLCPDKD